MNTVAIVQARMGSIRFPGKVLKQTVAGSLISTLLSRLSRARLVDEIVLATTTNAKDDLLAHHVEQLGFAVFRGDEHDVLDRYYQCAVTHGADTVVRITGDCPLIDPEVVDQVVDTFQSGNFDYASNIDPPSFPDGLDVEVCSVTALERIWRETTSMPHREHVTLALRESDAYACANVHAVSDLSGERWTVDLPEDFELVRTVVEHFFPDLGFSWQDVNQFLTASGMRTAATIIRNEGSQLSSGQKLWRRAKKVIPGGNMLLSKRAEMFLPEQWPAYFTKAKGCRVWDLDGSELIDMSLMGIGSNTLGYGHDEVDHAVHQTVDAGNLSTLNCPEEVELAERLVDLHPFADMARFCRTGGEANAVAIRIARAASGRDKVAFCGYHGWHDWYLAANLGDEKNLAGHLLPGLEPRGVPQDLAGTVLPFNYNRLDELEKLVRDHEIGVIKMEVSRNDGPQQGFLEGVRQLASDNDIVLIFDECTSGFRETFGGLHKKFGVEPDLAVFGKTLGNGYAITSVIGRRAVMEAAQTTFISSTFWTERIGPTAALKTLEVMEREKSWEQITATGTRIRSRWQQLADAHGLKISNWGLPALAGFSFASTNNLAYKTLITQEMLGKGYLASNAVYSCLAHTDEVVDSYFEALDPVFDLIRECEDGRDVMQLLKGPICHSGFKRLN